jgi:hypothetical protein
MQQGMQPNQPLTLNSPDEAAQWLQANPNDPRATQVQQKLQSINYNPNQSPTNSPTGQMTQKTAQQKENLGDKIMEFFGGVKEAWGGRKEKVEKANERYINNEQSGFETITQQFSQAPAFLGDMFFSGIKALASEKLETRTKEELEKIAPAIQPMVEKYTEWAKQNPRAAANLESVMNTAEIIPIGKGASLAKQGITKSTKYAIKETPKIASDFAKLSKTLIKSKDTTKKNLKALETVTSGNKPLKTFVEAQRKKGINVQEKLAQSNVLVGTVDKNGKISTLGKDGAAEQFYKKEIEGADKIVSKRLAEGNEMVSLEKIREDMTSAINEGNLAGSGKAQALKAIEKEIKGLELDVDENGMVPLEKINNAKITLNKTINYNDPEKALIQKDIARVLKETVENNIKDADVKAINRALQEKYAVLDFIERLDGRIVEGGRLGKYFSGIVGAGVGAELKDKCNRECNQTNR